jgi:hypothetical protein
MTNRIQIRRGDDTDRQALGSGDIKVGELLFTTDLREVWIGDGATAGGYDFIGAQAAAADIPVANIDGTLNNIITFDGSGDATLVTGLANEVLTLNGSGVPTFGGITSSNVNSGDFITSLSTDPGANKFVDAQTVRNYVINQLSGLSWRPPVDLIDTVNEIKPATTATTVDGIPVVDGDRVLFTNLQDSVESGDDEKVFVADVDSFGSITWTIETDGQAGNGDPTDGDTLFVQTGTVNADSTFNYNGTSWVLISNLSGALFAANNLSDVASPSSSLSNIGGIGAVTTNTLENKTIVSTGAGGNNPMTVDYTDLSDEDAGDILYWDGSAGPQTLPIGSIGQVLTVSAGLVPEWSTGSGGDVTGAGSSVVNEIIRFGNTTGDLLKNSGSARIADDATVGGDTMAPMTGVSIDAGTIA